MASAGLDAGCLRPAQLVASPTCRTDQQLCSCSHIANSTGGRGWKIFSRYPLLLFLETSAISFPPEYFLLVYDVSSKN